MSSLPSESPAISDCPTPAQIRGARGMLGWSMIELSRAAGLSVSTVKRAEDGSVAAGIGDVHGAIRDALEAGGIVFVTEGTRTGVLLQPA